MTKVVCVLDGDSACFVKKMFQARGWAVFGVDTDADADLVCFTGGADVSPSLYGEENISSHCDPARDVYEQSVYEAYLSAGTPMVGICRGGQFLNVMNGGKMIQDLKPRVSGVQKIGPTDGMGDFFEVLCDHHQGMVPEYYAHPEFAILCEYSKWDQDIYQVVRYPKTKSLCFQPHPEWGHKGTEELFFQVLNDYLGV